MTRAEAIAIARSIQEYPYLLLGSGIVHIADNLLKAFDAGVEAKRAEIMGVITAHVLNGECVLSDAARAELARFGKDGEEHEAM